MIWWREVFGVKEEYSVNHFLKGVGYFAVLSFLLAGMIFWKGFFSGGSFHIFFISLIFVMLMTLFLILCSYGLLRPFLFAGLLLVIQFFLGMSDDWGGIGIVYIQIPFMFISLLIISIGSKIYRKLNNNNIKIVVLTIPFLILILGKIIFSYYRIRT